MKKSNTVKEIEKLENQIKDLTALRKRKINKNSKNSLLNIFKRKNKKEIENLNNKIDELTKKLALLKTKSSVDLRAIVKNELKTYIIQKMLNEPKSSVIFKQINTIINEIMREINFNDYSNIKGIMKDEMIRKLKENFIFIENENMNILEGYKN